MRISDWSSDVCSSDLIPHHIADIVRLAERDAHMAQDGIGGDVVEGELRRRPVADIVERAHVEDHTVRQLEADRAVAVVSERRAIDRSEEHTSKLQSLMRISYAVFCLNTKTTTNTTTS